jgi:hypothetical protein
LRDTFNGKKWPTTSDDLGRSPMTERHHGCRYESLICGEIQVAVLVAEAAGRML